MREVLQTVQKPISAKILIPGSKSVSHRALLLAALAEGVSEIHHIQISEDVRTFVSALSELGIAVYLEEKSQRVVIAGGNGHFPKKHSVIWCKESGTLLRFLLAACGGISGAYYFDGALSLRHRPIASLLEILINQGVTCIPSDAMKLPFTLITSKPLMGGKIKIDAAKTSQMVSALLMIAPFMHSSLSLQVENLVSASYVDITCAMMAEFGVLVERKSSTEYKVISGQRYQARNYHVEPDLSTASYFFAAAAVTGGEVTIPFAHREKTLQGDSVFLTILEKMGCKIQETSSSLTVKGTLHLQGIEADMRDCPDLFMTLAAIAPFAKTPTVITHIGHARLKESDRLLAMREGLEQLGVRVEEGEDWLKIYPSTPHGGVIQSHHDHRIAMAFSIVGLRVPDMIIENSECVAKSCPEFFQLWKNL